MRDNVGNYSVSNARGKVDISNFVIQETAPEDYISDLYQEITDLQWNIYNDCVGKSGGQNDVMYTHKAVTKRKHIPLKQILMIGKKLLLQQI